jgi:hypothetical protein
MNSVQEITDVMDLKEKTEEVISLRNKVTISLDDVTGNDGVKKATFSNIASYLAPGISPNTVTRLEVSVTTSSEFNSDIHDDTILTNTLMEASTNALLLHHISESIDRNFSEICGNNKKAKNIHSRITDLITELNKELLNLIVKVG